MAMGQVSDRNRHGVEHRTGEDVAFASGRNRRWEISVAAGVFSQFNMGTPRMT
jgi:hypothetical protein